MTSSEFDVSNTSKRYRIETTQNDETDLEKVNCSIKITTITAVIICLPLIAGAGLLFASIGFKSMVLFYAGVGAVAGSILLTPFFIVSLHYTKSQIENYNKKIVPLELV